MFLFNFFIFIFSTRRLDCGVFVMKCMKIWKPFIDLRTCFSDKDILNIRIYYAIKLYFLSDNEADLSLLSDFYTKVRLRIFIFIFCIFNYVSFSLNYAFVSSLLISVCCRFDEVSEAAVLLSIMHSVLHHFFYFL
jgi:hypothetical protein